MFVRRAVGLTIYVFRRNHCAKSQFSTVLCGRSYPLPQSGLLQKIWTLGYANLTWEGGLLEGFSEAASSSITEAVENVTDQVTETLQNTKKSVEESIEESAKSVSGLVGKINESATKTIGEGRTLCEETGHSINNSIRDTSDYVNSVAQQAKSDIGQAKASSTVLIADIHKTTSHLQNKTGAFAADAKGAAEKSSSIVSDCTDHAKGGFNEVKKSLEGVQNVLNETVKNSTKSEIDKVIASDYSSVSDLNAKFAKNLPVDLSATTDVLKKTVEELKSSSAAAIQQELAVTLTTANAALREIVHDTSSATSNIAEVKNSATEVLKKSVDEIHFPTSSAIQQEIAVTLTTANAALREIVHDTCDTASKKAKEGKDSAADIIKKSVDEVNFPTSSAIQQELAVTITTASAALKEIVHDTSNVAARAVRTMGGCATKGSADISQGITGNDNAASEGSGRITSGNEKVRSVAETQRADWGQNQGNEEEEMPEILEAVVCQETDLKNGEMKEFNLGDEGSILLVKNDDGRFSALGTKCTHYGASMVNGILYKGAIRCPYHGACFNATTGDIEESPGLDSLPCYKVNVENGQVKVSAPKELLKKNIRMKDMTSKARRDSKIFVIIGGGAASQSCAETLRSEGFKGRIVLLTAEDVRPYDRPKLSKAMEMTATEIALRNEVFYQNSDIEVWMNHEVNSLDGRKRLIKCTNGASLTYDKLLIATGGKPRRLKVPGSDLKNISYLRTPEEANCILEHGKGKNVVVYGSSFIGMEVAAFMKGKANSVTIISRSSVPFVAVFGDDIGQRYKKFYESEGITFETGTEVVEFRGKNGKVSEVVCKNGKTLPADVVVIGIGVVPATDFLRNSDFPLTDAGFVPVNEYLETSVDDVFAAGDIAEFPITLYENQKAHVAHWQIAQCHGRNAAKNMLGKEEQLATVPFFWCVVLGKGIRYAGYCEDHDNIIVQGSLEDMAFAAYFCKGEDVRAVVSMSILTAVNYAHFVQHGKHLTKADLMKYPDNGWFKALA